MERRDFVKSGLAAGVTALAGGACASTSAAPAYSVAYSPARAAAPGAGSLKHSVCKWCYPRVSLDELAQTARRLGMSSIELLDPQDWPTLKRHGLVCAMSNAPGKGGIPQGWNRVENHAWLIPAYRERIQQAREAGNVPNVICFSGNRAGMSDEEGLENCAKGLKEIMPDAEKAGITIVMELLNSKVDHKDYMCDHTAWGVALAKRVGSERFKLLYDIYHMQIMEGDVIRTIRESHDYIAHYHTGGVPGRHEIDGTQELYYPAVMQAIVATGFQGYVAQEFIPAREPLASLEEAVRICRV